jgi:hypothetical protein
VLVVELAPLREAVGGLYMSDLAKMADSGQIYRLALAQGFAAGGVVTISEKMDLFEALCRGEVEIVWACSFAKIDREVPGLCSAKPSHPVAGDRRTLARGSLLRALVF